MPENLRDYQVECLEALLARYRAGVRRTLVCLPTGTGKTLIFAAFPFTKRTFSSSVRSK